MIVAATAILGFLLLMAFIVKTVHDHKEEKMKIEAVLRMEEMKKGYAPGTYSASFSSRKARKAMNKEVKRMKKGGAYDFRSQEDLERENLEKGIRDLEERMRNLDEILKERKAK